MSSYRATFKDWLNRSVLETKSAFRYIFNIQKNKYFNIPSEYKLVFSEFFQEDYNNNWILLEKMWGRAYHPDNLIQWFNAKNIKQTSEGIELSAIVNPRYFKEIDTIIPNSVVFLATKEHWQYGIFSFTAKLPKGTYLWPALWLTGSKSWPPEIDLLEAYSGGTLDYKRNKILKSNVFMREGEEASSIRARTHPVTKNVTEEFVEYVLHWEKDFIKMYYDGYLVRHITDKRVLDLMNETQRVVINSAVMEGFTTDNVSPLVVKNIKIYQK